MAVFIPLVDHFCEARYIKMIFQHMNQQLNQYYGIECCFLYSLLTKSIIYTWTGVGCKCRNRIR